MRLDARTRTKLLEAGQWQTAKGSVIELRTMPDGHLINALIKTLADAHEPFVIAKLLGAEVMRRGIWADAESVAAKREGRTA